VTPLGHLAPQLSSPLLGLFGAEDKFPSPEHVAELEGILQAQGKDFEFHSYLGAGHAFFAAYRPSYRPEAANEGWEEIWEFFGRHLAS
jgi:carboxymethylenebutenolidase